MTQSVREDDRRSNSKLILNFATLSFAEMTLSKSIFGVDPMLRKNMDNTIEQLADLYVWGLPLVIMHRTRALHCNQGGPGVLRHMIDLATARNRTVVAPNNDTLYSTGWYDLSYGDLRLDVPPMDHPDRYWSVMILDAFTHLTYVSRRLYGVNGASAVLTYDPSVEQNHSIAADKIAVGAPTVWVVVRTLVDGPDDLAQARAVQEKITVTAPSGHPSNPTEKPPNRPDKVYTAGALFFDELCQALKIDPPADWHPRLTSEQQGFSIKAPIRKYSKPLSPSVIRG